MLPASTTSISRADILYVFQLRIGRHQVRLQTLTLQILVRGYDILQPSATSSICGRHGLRLSTLDGSVRPTLLRPFNSSFKQFPRTCKFSLIATLNWSETTPTRRRSNHLTESPRNSCAFALKWRSSIWRESTSQVRATS